MRLSKAFLRAYDRHRVVPGTQPARLIAAAIRRLGDAEELPRDGHQAFLMLPSLAGFLTVVEGTGFVLAYTVDAAEVVILTLRVR